MDTATFNEISPELLADREALLASLIERSVIRGEREQMTSSTGKPSRWTVDTRVLLLDPVSMRRIARLFLDAVRDFGPFQLACLEMTGIPLMLGIQHTALTQGLEINGLIVRKERKGHGRMRAIEGTPNDLPVIFVDDLLNSASSFAQGMEVLRFNGLSVPLFWALIDFHRDSGAQRVIDAGCSFITEFQLEELGIDYDAPPQPQLDTFPFSPAWQHRPPSEIRSFHVIPKSVPVFGSGMVFYGAENGCFYALDQKTGAECWSKQTGRQNSKGIFSSALLIEDTVIFGAYDGNVYCLEQKTGNERWRFSGADWVGSCPSYIPSQQRIIIGLEHSLASQGGSVVAIDWTTGERVWECPVPGLVHGTPLPIDKHNLIAIGTNDRELLILDAETGYIRVIIPVGGAVKSIPAYDPENNAVLFGSYDQKLYSVSLGDFLVRWTVSTDDILYSQPLIMDGKAYLTASDRSVYRIDLATGVILRRAELVGRVFGHPKLINDDLYVGTTAGRLYVIDRHTMNVRSFVQLHERITTAIGVAENGAQICVLTNDSVLTSFTRPVPRAT